MLLDSAIIIAGFEGSKLENGTRKKVGRLAATSLHRHIPRDWCATAHVTLFDHCLSPLAVLRTNLLYY